MVQRGTNRRGTHYQGGIDREIVVAPCVQVCVAICIAEPGERILSLGVHVQQ
jgi:hypothetical protein